ncbi:WXG100 family type VII secretion target [Clostridium gasigenes]|uniref:ESAT-6-like protein n=1 Tax=Clostridium gasigenes TaxID=94869 RepID=A0A7X0VTC0_9CLOT|nr:WXG100 family type VII secretion target [Clostridium gasigenes]MBB6716640.1 WXG100 family type VII secretion target [Clostridium gasigenes]
MSRVEVDVEEFKRAAQTFITAADNCKAMEYKIKQVTEGLLNTWEGDTKKAFRNEYNDLTKGMYNYDEMLRIIADDINRIGESFKEVDNELKKSILK